MTHFDLIAALTASADRHRGRFTMTCANGVCTASFLPPGSKAIRARRREVGAALARLREMMREHDYAVEETSAENFLHALAPSDRARVGAVTRLLRELRAALAPSVLDDWKAADVEPRLADPRSSLRNALEMR
jgi:hypothetical protein